MLRRTSFRRAAFATAIVGATALASFSAAGAERDAANCDSIKDDVKGAICEYNTLKQREKDANRRTAAARRSIKKSRESIAASEKKEAEQERRIQEMNAQMACLDYLSEQVVDKGKKTVEMLYMEAGGEKFFRAKVCDVAKENGFVPPRAEISTKPPRVEAAAAPK